MAIPDFRAPKTGMRPRIASPVPAHRAKASRLHAIRTPPPVIQGLLAFAIYLIVFVGFFTRPLVSHLGVPDVGQDWTDPNFYTWALDWWPYALRHGINPLYSVQIGAPGGYSLAWASTAPSVAVAMWPVTALFGPVVAYNLVLLTIPPVSGCAAFIAARRLTGRFWPALLAGAVYGLSPFELIHTMQGQPNLTVIALLPLMVYLVLAWRDGTLGRTGYIAWMALAMAAEFYTFTEAFFDMTMVWAGTLLIGLAVAGRTARAVVARLAGLTALAYAGALVLAAPYLLYALSNGINSVTRQSPFNSLRLVRLILPYYRLFGISPLVRDSYTLGDRSVENYVGLPMLALLLALVVFAWRDRVARLLGFGFVFVIALAAGPGLIITSGPVFALPWGALWTLPLARSAEPSRCIIFANLIAALALAVWLARPVPSRAGRAARLGLALLAVTAILAGLPGFSPAVVPSMPSQDRAVTHPVNQLPPFIVDGMYRRYLTPGETVVVVTERGNAGMLFQAAAGFYFRIAGGFINASLTPKDALPNPVALLAWATPSRVRAFRVYVTSAGVGAILVENAWAEPWIRVFARIGMRGMSSGGVTVYPTSTLNRKRVVP